MVEAEASLLVSAYWDEQLPIDPVPIAHALGVEVFRDSAMQSEWGRYKFGNDRRPARICVNPKLSSAQQRLTVAHELGHHVLKHGRRFLDTGREGFVDTAREFDVNQLDLYERQANLFALEVLMPRKFVDFLVMKKNIVDSDEMNEIFGIPQSALIYKLQRTGWYPWKNV
jgi:Zn-dependent peptidase ImmA (M78 family)